MTLVRGMSIAALLCLVTLGACNKNTAADPNGKLSAGVPENDQTKGDKKKVDVDQTNSANKTRAAGISRAPAAGRVSRIWLDNRSGYRLFMYVQGRGDSFSGNVRAWGDAYADVWHNGTVAVWGYAYDDAGDQIATFYYKEHYVGNNAEFKINLTVP